jgi:hypothetical protein
MRILVALLALQVAGPLPLAAGPPAGRAPAGPTPSVLVTVRTLAIDGLGALGIDENALLARNVALAWDEALIPPGWVAPRSGLARRSVPLWQLGGVDRAGLPFHGSALTALLEELETGIRESGVEGSRVELDRGALRRLSTPGSDGLLLLRVSR